MRRERYTFVFAAQCAVILLSLTISTLFPLFSSAQSTCPRIATYLELGTTHQDVVTLKQYLQSEGLLSGVQNTTYFGATTESAVRAWQVRKGISATGTVGPLTRAALANCGAATAAPQQQGASSACPYISLPLARGSSNAEVFSLQRYLSSLGLLSADSLTGYFGSLTERALQTWQAQRGIVTQGTPSSTGFGVTGPRTRAALLNCFSGSGLPSGSISAPIGTVPPGTSSDNQSITPLPSTPSTCVLHGVTISSGADIIAYKSSSIASGESCMSEKRTCHFGNLSGSYQYLTCSRGTNASCIFGGNTVAHGAGVTAYQAATVAAGQSCLAQTRLCSDGILSGTYGYTSCSVAGSGSACSLDGVSVSSGSSRTFYAARSVAAGATCASISLSRTCTNGSLNGSTNYQYATCSVAGSGTAACTFNGNTVAHGASVTAYQAATAATCASQTRSCSNGVLSGSYAFSSCTPATSSAACTLDGVTVAHGASQTFYSTRTASGASACALNAQTRTCANGTLSGSTSYQYSSCSNSSTNASCTFNGNTVVHGASVTAYQAATVPNGSSCVSQSRSCSNGTLSGTYTYASCSVAGPAPVAIDIPDPIYPTIPSGSENNAAYISNGDVYAATSIATYGAALTSVIRGGYEYVINDPPATPQYKRGGSWQGSFFFNSPLASSGANHTYYNDCNNPIETGSVADFNTSFYGITSPTRMYSPSAGVMHSSAQLAYYVDPNGPTDWWDPDNTAISGSSATCQVGKINNPQFTVRNNAALSGLYMGKIVTLANIGTAAKPINIPGVIAIDMVLVTDKTYTYSGLHPAFASFPNPPIDNMATYDPRTKTLSGVLAGVSGSAFGRNPVIAYTSDNTKAIGIYTPQVALEGEPSGGGYGYLRTAFSTGLSTMMQFIRYDTMPGGSYKYKSYYIVGTLAEVKIAMDSLYMYFKILDPKVFNWSYYVSQNGLGSMSEDQARLHWVTTGIKQGLQAHASFSVQTYLASNPALQAQFGTNYFAVVQHYVDSH